MHSAFIDAQINQSDFLHVEQIITKNDGIITDDSEKADIIIKNNGFIMDLILKKKIYTINCLFTMEKELINPFTYTGQSKILINLFLRNKTFSFYKCTDATMKNCSKLIQMMDGSITTENPDYYLIEHNTEPINSNSVLVDWIYSLKCSNEYIFPQKFVNPSLHSKKKNNASQKIYQKSQN